MAVMATMALKAQFLGEIRMFAGNYAPDGWALCDGSQLPIAEYYNLYSLIGTTWGGDGQSTFALPDLRGRAPMHRSNSHVLGQSAGAETVTLSSLQMPAHTHQATISLPVSGGVPNADSPAGNFTAVNPARGNEFNTTANGTMGTVTFTVNANSSLTGQDLAHENMKPYVVINYIICLTGLYPSQN